MVRDGRRRGTNRGAAVDPEAFAASHSAGDQLVVAVNNGGPAVQVRLAGELDMATVDELTQTIEQICQSDQRQVILDLSNLDFCDACGLTAILAVQRRLKTVG